jgi:hypothetical protein
MKKDYSLMAHALHSRLQLVRQHLHAKPGMEPAEVVLFNQVLFNKAAESVRIYHHYCCQQADYLDAAELLLMSAETESPVQRPQWTVHKNEFYCVEMRDTGNDWSVVTQDLITSYKGEFSAKMNYQQALLLYRFLCKRSSAANFRISRVDPLHQG